MLRDVPRVAIIRAQLRARHIHDLEALKCHYVAPITNGGRDHRSDADQGRRYGLRHADKRRWNLLASTTGERTDLHQSRHPGRYTGWRDWEGGPPGAPCPRCGARRSPVPPRGHRMDHAQRARGPTPASPPVASERRARTQLSRQGVHHRGRTRGHLHPDLPRRYQDTTLVCTICTRDFASSGDPSHHACGFSQPGGKPARNASRTVARYQ